MRLRIGVLAAGAALGVFAEWTALQPGPLEPAPDPGDFAFAAGDLIVGMALIACGLLARARRGESRIGPLLTGTGFAWFAGTFGYSSLSPYAEIGSALATLHRGPLVHAILAYPSGRLRGGAAATVAAIAYATAVIAPLGQSDVVTVVLAVALAGAAAYRVSSAAGRERRARVAPLVAATAFAVVLIASAAVGLDGGTPATERALAWTYQAVVLTVGVVLTADLVVGRWTATTVAQLVVDLGRPAEAGDLRARLAHALGDSSLEVFYWVPEAGAYVDPEGRPLRLPEAGGERVATHVRGDPQPLAVLIHDAAVLGDPDLLEAVGAAARLAVSNARLQAEIRQQAAALAASRRRVLETGDAQRRRLGEALRQGVQPRLDAVSSLLELKAASGEFGDLVAETRREVERAHEELQAFASGVHPRLLTEAGLRAALAELGERLPLRVDLEAPSERLPAALEEALYFVCAEALTNAVKHAHATRVWVQVRRDATRVALAVDDDGRGGASVDDGDGLRNLADRIEAVGGTVSISSPVGTGTHLRAEVPFT